MKYGDDPQVRQWRQPLNRDRVLIVRQTTEVIGEHPRCQSHMPTWNAGTQDYKPDPAVQCQLDAEHDGLHEGGGNITHRWDDSHSGWNPPYNGEDVAPHETDEPHYDREAPQS